MWHTPFDQELCDLTQMHADEFLRKAQFDGMRAIRPKACHGSFDVLSIDRHRPSRRFDLTHPRAALRKGMSRYRSHDNIDLTALEACIASAWVMILPRMAADPREDERYQERLAKIVLDHLMAEHEQGEICAKAAAEKFLAHKL